MRRTLLSVSDLPPRLNPAPLVASAWVQGYAESLGFVGEVEDAYGKFMGADGPDCHAVAGGTGNGPRVIVLDDSAQWTDGAILEPRVLASFFAFEEEFREGMRIESVRMGDGSDAIVAAPREGGGAWVKMFDGHGTQLGATLAFADPSYRGGIGYLAGYDLDHDGVGEIIVTPGAGGGPMLEVIDPETHRVELHLLIGPSDDRSGGYRPVPAGLGGEVNGRPVIAVQGPDGPQSTLLFDLDGNLVPDDFLASPLALSV